MFTFVSHVIPTETNVVSEMECIPRMKGRIFGDVGYAPRGRYRSLGRYDKCKRQKAGGRTRPPAHFQFKPQRNACVAIHDSFAVNSRAIGAIHGRANSRQLCCQFTRLRRNSRPQVNSPQCRHSIHIPPAPARFRFTVIIYGCILHLTIL